MSDNNEIGEQFEDLMGKIPKNFSLLEKQIDVDIQMEYFKQASESRSLDKEDVIEKQDLLFNDEISDEEKKDILTQLAGIDDVEIFRTIEKYYNSENNTIKDWTYLALTESKLVLESSLLDENKVFISTGLGGIGKKLRYFIVFTNINKIPFNNYQKELIKNEVEYSLEKNDSQIENVNFFDNYCSIKALIPLDSSLPQIFRSAIKECNSIENFIDENFIITNVKELSTKDINEFVNKRENKDDELT